MATMTPTNRVDAMVLLYGEVCSISKAGRILHRDRDTIKKMFLDGRLDRACEGTMVDVRSIARYIMSPKQEDEEARKRRIKLKHNSEWAV